MNKEKLSRPIQVYSVYFSGNLNQSGYYTLQQLAKLLKVKSDEKEVTKAIHNMSASIQKYTDFYADSSATNGLGYGSSSIYDILRLHDVIIKENKSTELTSVDLICHPKLKSKKRSIFNFSKKNYEVIIYQTDEFFSDLSSAVVYAMWRIRKEQHLPTPPYISYQ